MSAPRRLTVEGMAAEVRREELMRWLMATGHTVMVADARYFANFGHFHYKGQDVMMPFWVNSQIAIPGTRRPLLVPVSHAEYEWEIRGPKVQCECELVLRHRRQGGVSHDGYAGSGLGAGASCA